MNELKQKAWLLIVIAILATAKFIIIPIVDWQNIQLAEIQLLKKKLAKTQYILANKEKIEKINHQLRKELAKSNTLFFSFPSDSLFKLEQQKMLESLLTQFSLTSQNIGWKNITKLAEFNLQKFQVEVKISGKTINVIELMTELETMLPRIEIENFNISIKKQQKSDLGFSTGRMTLNLYSQITDKKTLTINGSQR